MKKCIYGVTSFCLMKSFTETSPAFKAKRFLQISSSGLDALNHLKQQVLITGVDLELEELQVAPPYIQQQLPTSSTKLSNVFLFPEILQLKYLFCCFCPQKFAVFYKTLINNCNLLKKNLLRLWTELLEGIHPAMKNKCGLLLY